jgi:hypothetical protein
MRSAIVNKTLYAAAPSCRDHSRSPVLKGAASDFDVVLGDDRQTERLAESQRERRLARRGRSSDDDQAAAHARNGIAPPSYTS